jgi:hypothetical protein
MERFGIASSSVDLAHLRGLLGTVRAMQPDTAVRLATVAGDELVTVDQAAAIVGEFLRRLAVCSACMDAGTIVYGRDVTLMGPGTHGESKLQMRAGMESACPSCGGSNGDAEWVKWFCAVSDQRGYGTPCRPGATGRDDGEHTTCGWRLILPLDLMDRET